MVSQISYKWLYKCPIYFTFLTFIPVQKDTRLQLGGLLKQVQQYLINFLHAQQYTNSFT